MSSAASTPPPDKPPAPRLRTLNAGETPQYIGLQCDGRGIVVGAQGLIVQHGDSRRAALLAALSHVINLAGVQIETAGEQADTPCNLLTLTPPPQDDSPLSLFYDAIQGALAAAHLRPPRTRLYVGDGRVFVPYRTPTTPHGSDAEGQPPTSGRALLTPQGTRLLNQPQPANLLAALLEVPLLPTQHRAPPHTLAVLTDRRLAALIADYVQRHGLAYAVRFLTWQQAQNTRQAALFDIVTASAIHSIPGFVCDFLHRLPRTILLTDALEPADLEHEPPRRVLVAWGQRTPLYLPHVQELLPPAALLVLTASAWGTALLNPPPPRQYMRQLTSVQSNVPASVSVSEQPAGRLTLQLQLLHSRSSDEPIHGLLLDSRALQRLRRIVRRLPAPLFAHMQIALGDEMALLIADDPQREIEGLPSGQPLVRADPPDLLLPRGMHLHPILPPDLLIPTLRLPPDTLTVLTPSRRYTVARTALQPLASLLKLDAPEQTTPINVQPLRVPLPDLPDLPDLSNLPAPEPPHTPAPPPEPSHAPAPPTDEPHPARSRNIEPRAAPDAAAHLSFEEQLRQHAARLEQSGDYATAAVFYDYLRDDERAAACYQRVLSQQHT